MVRRRTDSMLAIVFLNICGGQWFEELKSYLQEIESTVDIFCFQEVLDTPEADEKNIAKMEEEIKSRGREPKADIYQQLCGILKEHFPFYSSYSRLPAKPGPLYIGNAMFIRRGGRVVDTLACGDEMVFRARDSMKGIDVATLARSVQVARVKLASGDEVNIFNYHGLWVPEGKEDVPVRIEQFENLRDIVNRYQGPTILGGDFNALPRSKSSLILEETGMDNLVALNGIHDTRGKLYPRGDRGTHADNIFIKGFGVVQFQVPQLIAVSDHLPLELRCSV